MNSVRKLKNNFKLSFKFSSSKVRNTMIVLYVLAILGFSAAARASQGLYPIGSIPKATQDAKVFTGELALTLDGKAFLIVSDRQYFELSSQEDLSPLNGLQVEVLGYDLMRKIGPIYHLSAFNPAEEIAPEQKEMAPSIIVLDIRELVE